MNWARGLFRSWVVLSALWVVGISVVFISGTTVETALPRDDAENLRWLLEGADYERNLAVRQFNQGIRDYALYATLPPVLVLALGAGCLWAARGFRRT